MRSHGCMHRAAGISFTFRTWDTKDIGATCVLEAKLGDDGSNVLRHKLWVDDHSCGDELRFRFEKVDVFNVESWSAFDHQDRRQLVVASGGPALVGPWLPCSKRGDEACGAEECIKADGSRSNITTST